MDEVAKVGGDVVTRFEGDADAMTQFLDELAADRGGDPLLLELKALAEEMNAGDTFFDFDATFFSVGASGAETSGVTFFRFVLAGENEVPPVSGDSDAGDFIEAFMADSEVMNLNRVVGLPDETNAAAAAGDSVYILSFGDIPAASGDGSSADVMLIL